MRHFIGFTGDIKDRPFHITEVDGAFPSLTVGQLVNIREADTGWLRITQVGTDVQGERTHTTVVVGPPPPAGLLADGSEQIWPSDGANW